MSAAEVLKVSLFGYVFSDELVCILYCAFLPGGIRVSEIDDDFSPSLSAQYPCDLEMCSELASVVSRYSLD